MKGSEFVRIIERELASQGISKTDFYKNCNLSSATFSNWRNNINQPTLRNIQIVSDYLGINIGEEPAQDADADIGNMVAFYQSKMQPNLQPVAPQQL